MAKFNPTTLILVAQFALLALMINSVAGLPIDIEVPSINERDFTHSGAEAAAQQTAGYAWNKINPRGFGNAEQSRSEQSKSEAKLHKLSTENQRLMEVHKKTPIHVSEASTSIIHHCQSTKDHLVPSVWGPVNKAEDPYALPARNCVAL